MAFEDGIEWKPISPELRGRHKTVSSAFDAAFKALTVERSEFFDSLVDNWARLFPSLPARPGRFENGRIYIYVRNAPTSYMIRPRLREIAARLAALPGAPARSYGYGRRTR